MTGTTDTLRGADIIARSLARLGCTRVFTLSGNHIMSVFDALVASGPSRSIERIISAKIVERLAVSTFVPSGSSTLSVAFAIRRRL